jgi:hypothetical protein
MHVIQSKVEKAGLDFPELVKEVQQTKVHLVTLETEDEILDEVYRVSRETLKRFIDTHASLLFDETQYEELISREVHESMSSYNFMEYLRPAFNLLYCLGRKIGLALSRQDLLRNTPFSIDNLYEWDKVLVAGAKVILTDLVHAETWERLDHIKRMIRGMTAMLVQDYEKYHRWSIPQKVAESVNIHNFTFYPRNSPLFKNRDTAEMPGEEIELYLFLDSQINNQCAIIYDIEDFTIAFLWYQD